MGDPKGTKFVLEVTVAPTEPDYVVDAVRLGLTRSATLMESSGVRVVLTEDDA